LGNFDSGRVERDKGGRKARYIGCSEERMSEGEREHVEEGVEGCDATRPTREIRERLSVAKVVEERRTRKKGSHV